MKFFLTFSHGLQDVFSEPRVLSLMAFTIAMILSATVLFTLVEGWSLIDSAFFAVVTISTVGYGDLTPVTSLGKVLCMFYIIVGLGVFVAAASAIGDVLLKRYETDELARKARRGGDTVGDGQ